MSAHRHDPCPLRGAGAGTSSSRVYFFPVLALALLLRLVMAHAMAKGEPAFWFYNQASELGCLAHSLNSGYGFASPFCGATGPSAFLAPGYPLFVAAIFRGFGELSDKAATALVAIQMLFGLLIVLTLMLLTRRVFGARTANIAGVLCAVSPTMVWLPVLFWETSLSILSLTGAMALAIRCVDRPKHSNWTAIGLLFGFAMLVNPALATTLAAIFGWLLWQNRKTGASLVGPLLAAAVWILIFAAWPVRNQMVLHSFIPLRSNLGYELWQGNHPGSNGDFDPELHLNVNRIERARYARIGEVAYMREKSALAVAAIKANPARFGWLSLKRFARFWIGLNPRKQSAIVIASTSFTSFFALLGLVLLARREPAFAILFALPFLLFPLPYYLTHPDFRFRLLLDPIAMALSTYAIQCWRRSATGRVVERKLEIATLVIG